MKFKIIIICILFLLLFACDNESDDCLPRGPIKLDITGANIETLVIAEDKTYANRITGEKYNGINKVAYKELVFSIDSDVQTIITRRKKSKNMTFSIISSAYACSYIPPSTDEQIVDIKITSSTAFNNELGTWDSLKSKFEVVYADYATDYYSYQNSEYLYYSLSDYLKQDEVYAGNTIQLRLTEAPEFVDNHIFYIELSLNTGEVFTLETFEISFK